MTWGMLQSPLESIGDDLREVESNLGNTLKSISITTDHLG